MKRITVFVISLFVSLMVFSQDVQYEDVVYLKNGSVIRGMIIEQSPNQSITIQTADRKIFANRINRNSEVY